jgi:hypothetical protein
VAEPAAVHCGDMQISNPRYWITRLGTLVLLTGATLHGLRLIYGVDWLLEHFFTPTFDMVLALPMTVVAIGLWLCRDSVRPGTRIGRVAYFVVAGYFTLSLPFHWQTYFTHSTEYIRLFDAWYSVVIVCVQLHGRATAIGTLTNG